VPGLLGQRLLDLGSLLPDVCAWQPAAIPVWISYDSHVKGPAGGARRRCERVDRCPGGWLMAGTQPVAVELAGDRWLQRHQAVRGEDRVAGGHDGLVDRFV